MGVEVLPVSGSRSEARAFLELPYTLYASEWVPLRGQVRL
jgi:hypothetical protein